MRFNEFTKTLRLTDESTGELNETGQKIRRTFQGIFAVLDIVTTVLGGGFKIAWKVASEVLSYFGMGLLDVTAIVGDWLVAAHDFLFGLVDIHDILDVIVPAIKTVVEWVKDWFAELKDSGKLQAFVDSLASMAQAAWDFIIAVKNSDEFNAFINYIKNAATALFNFFAGLPDLSEFKNLISVVGGAIESIGKWISSLKDSENVAGDIVAGLVNGLANGIPTVVTAVLKLAAAIISGICDALGIHSPSTVMIAIGGFLIAGLVTGLQNGVGGLWNTLSELCGGIWEIVTTTLNKLVEFVKGLDFGTVLSAALVGGVVFALIGISSALGKIATGIAGFGDMLEEFGDLCKNVGKGVKNYLNAKAVQSLVIAITTLVAALIGLAVFMKDEGNTKAVWSAVGVLSVLTGLVIALVAVIAVLDKFVIGADGVGDLIIPLLTVAGTMLILAVVLKIIADIDATAAYAALKRLGIMVVALGVFLLAIGGLSKAELLTNVDKAGIMLMMMAGAMLIMVYVIKIAGQLKTSEITKGLAVVTLVGVLFAAVIMASKFAGEHASGAGGMLLKMSIAMLIMVGVVKLAAGLEIGEVKRGIAVVAAIEILFMAIVAVSAIAGEHASRAGGMLLYITRSSGEFHVELQLQNA